MKWSKLSPLFPFGTGLLLVCIFFGCKPKDDYDYIPLKEYRYDHAKIDSGTEVRILAFSGGRRSDKENIYYAQFIVLNKASGDTLRILTPLISVEAEAGAAKKTYSSPDDYDPAKNITTAFYEPQNSAHNFFLQSQSLDDKIDSMPKIQLLMDSILLKEFVVVNKTIHLFEDPKFATAAGILNFKQNPL